MVKSAQAVFKQTASFLYLDWSLETFIRASVGFSAAFLTFLVGEFSYLLGALLVFITLDYISGFGAAKKEGKLSSRVGGLGILRKFMIIGVVSMAHLSDLVLAGALVPVNDLIGYDGNLLRDAAIYFYLANEGLSIYENCKRLGLEFPDSLKKVLDLFAEKSDKQAEQQGKEINDKNKKSTRV